jgi:hypothetical protein
MSKSAYIMFWYLIAPVSVALSVGLLLNPMIVYILFISSLVLAVLLFFIDPFKINEQKEIIGRWCGYTITYTDSDGERKQVKTRNGFRGFLDVTLVKKGNKIRAFYQEDGEAIDLV